MLILDWLNIVAVLVLFTKEACHIPNPREYIGEPTVSSQGIGAKMENIKNKPQTSKTLNICFRISVKVIARLILAHMLVYT